jgi:hypothetical protein
MRYYGRKTSVTGLASAGGTSRGPGPPRAKTCRPRRKKGRGKLAPHEMQPVLMRPSRRWAVRRLDRGRPMRRRDFVAGLGSAAAWPARAQAADDAGDVWSPEMSRPLVNPPKLALIMIL